MNTLVTISSRKAMEKLKTFEKGAMVSFLVGPPSHKQIHFMEWERFRRTGRAWYLAAVDEELSENAKQKLVRDCVSQFLYEVGPIPRAISNASNYYSRCGEMRLDPVLSNAFDCVDQLSPSNVPPALKYFLAPYPINKRVKEEAIQVKGNKHLPVQILPELQYAPMVALGFYTFLFLSPEARIRFNSAKITRLQAEKLQSAGLNFLVAESIVADALARGDSDSEGLPSWKWYLDLGFGTKLDLAHRINPLPIPVVTCDSSFEDAFIGVSVDTLEQGCLYTSRAHNFRLGDMVMVDHRTKTCFYFQVTLLNLKKHPVKISVLKDVMTRLQILEKNYTLQLIFIVDVTAGLPSGSKFEATVGLKDGQLTTAAFTLEEWKAFEMQDKIKRRSDKVMFSERVKSVIVRTKLTQDSRVEVSDRSTGAVTMLELRKMLDLYGIPTQGQTEPPTASLSHLLIFPFPFFR
jgi:hypothetical protein